MINLHHSRVHQTHIVRAQLARCTQASSFLKVFFLWEFCKNRWFNALSQTVIKHHHWLWKGRNFCYAPARLNIQRSNKTRFPLNHIFIFSARVKLLIARPPHLFGSKSSRRVFLFNAHRKPKPLAHELWINKFFWKNLLALLLFSAAEKNVLSSGWWFVECNCLADIKLPRFMWLCLLIFELCNRPRLRRLAAVFCLVGLAVSFYISRAVKLPCGAMNDRMKTSKSCCKLLCAWSISTGGVTMRDQKIFFLIFRSYASVTKTQCLMITFK